jgi:Uncharacterized protein conserved in bacteria (DUF2325)
MTSSAAHRRKLWTMKCESLFQILAASFSPEELDKLFRKYQVALPEAPRGHADLYQLAHQQCHHETPFSRHLQRHLQHKHAAVVRRFATHTPESIHQTLGTLLSLGTAPLPADLAGMLWTVASDPSPALRPVEHWLVDALHLFSHQLLLEHIRHDATVSASTDAQLIALQREVEQLQAERRGWQKSLQCLEQQATRLTQHNDRLQRQLDALSVAYATLQRQHTPPLPATPESSRELKKLRYQIDKLTASLADQEAEQQRLQILVASYEAILGEQTGEPEVAAPHNAADTSLPAMLHGKKIALIGGLGRAAPYYEQTIRQLGGCCLFHDGDLGQGQRRLADVIKQADIVFCPVDRTSHGATAAAKKLCRALHKPCYFLRSSGISHLREKLRELPVKT